MEVLLAALVLAATGWLVVAVSLDGTVRLRLPSLRLGRPHLLPAPPLRRARSARRGGWPRGGGSAQGRGSAREVGSFPGTGSTRGVGSLRGWDWPRGAVPWPAGPSTLADDLWRGARARREGRLRPAEAAAPTRWRDRGDVERRVGAALRLLVVVTVLGVGLGAVLATALFTTVGRSPALAP